MLQELRKELNKGYTENGAVTNRSTFNKLLDFYAVSGALRSRDEDEIYHLFVQAFLEDPLLAMKSLFHTRNIRGGLGERRTFKVILKRLADDHPNAVAKNIRLIPEFGTWKDMQVLFGTKCELSAISELGYSFQKDYLNACNGEKVSMLAKWMPTEKSNPRYARKIARFLDLSATQYRHRVSELREYIKVPERLMSTNRFGEIDYETVPSQCIRKNKGAFLRNDMLRFGRYLSDLEKGDAVIKASTVFPYEILRDIGFSMYGSRSLKRDKVAEAQWKALPNYVDGDQNVLVVADTSGSMNGLPVLMSVSLALYFAERNNGSFKNNFMIFSEEPKLATIKGVSLFDDISMIPRIDARNTNIQSVFDLILTTAVNNGLPQEDIPTIVIISDMEFDMACGNSGWSKGAGWNETNFSVVKEKFANAGYTIPELIFWNVDSRRDNIPVTADERGVQLVSGGSPSVFKSVMSSIGTTPYEAMMEVLNDPMYDEVTV